MNPTPIIITSPVRRSGTTLLQRLFSSASNTLIYGENAANDLNFFSNLVANKEMLFRQSKDWRNAQLQDVLDGNVNQWIPDLMPDIEGYLSAYRATVLKMISHYAEFAAKNGKTIWGVKLPEWHPVQLSQLRQLLPAAKIIYLHRNLADCLCSAKGIQMVQNLNEVRQFCRNWKQYTDYALQHLKGNDILHIHYEELIKSPASCINTLEHFTGARDIVRQVMDVKVNTFAGDQRLEPETPQAYLKPVALTDEEKAIVHEFSSATRAVIE